MQSYVAEAHDNIPRDPLVGAGRASRNVSGTSCKLFEEDAITNQEHPVSYMKRMLQRIRNVSQVIYRRCSDVSRTSSTLLEERVRMYQELLLS